MITTVEALYTQAAELDIWETAFHDAQARHMSTLVQVENEMNQLKENLAEIKAEHGKVIGEYQRALRREQLRGRLPGIGVFIGPGVTQSGNVQVSAGIGLVWKW